MTKSKATRTKPQITVLGKRRGEGVGVNPWVVCPGAEQDPRDHDSSDERGEEGTFYPLDTVPSSPSPA